MDGQAISHCSEEQYYSDEDGKEMGEEEEDGEEEEEMEYLHYGSEQQSQEFDEDQDALAEDTVPVMPAGFYSDVDSFLSRPPPMAVKGTKGGKKKKKGSGEEKLPSSLPVINDLPKMSHVKSKVSSHRTGASGGNSKKAGGVNKVLDERLLQQAFEYTNKLQQEAMAEEVYEASLNMQAQKSSSAPQLRPQHQQLHDYEQGQGHGRGARKPRSADTDFPQGGSTNRQHRVSGDGKKKPANSIVRRLRSKTQTNSNQGGKPPRSTAKSGGFDTSIDGESATSTRNVTDFQSLVANFEQGTHLQQLRAELEESQASMAESRRAMQDISKEMAGKLRI